MHPRTPLACLALCATLALAACDRRDTNPPEESRTTTDQVSPPGVQAGHVTAPDPSRSGGDRCLGLTGDALQECTSQDDGVPMVLGNEEAGERTGEATDRPPNADPAEPNPTSDQDGNLQ